MLRTWGGLCCDRGEVLLIGVAGLRRGEIAVVPGVPLAAARCPLPAARCPLPAARSDSRSTSVHASGSSSPVLLINPQGRVEDHRSTLNRVNDMVSMEANSAIRWSFDGRRPTGRCE
jgi:hypothetical protein